MKDTFLYWIGLPHEIFHYLAARLLGVKAWIGIGATDIERCTLWKEVVIALAPAVVSLLAMFSCGWQAATAILLPVRAIWSLWLLSSILWFLACGKDFVGVWRLLRRDNFAGEN